MKKAVMMVMMGVGMIAGAAPVVSGVQCKQRYPWNGKVDVTFTVTGVTEAEQTADVADGKITHFVMVSTNFVNGAEERALEMKTFTDVAGAKVNLASIAVTNGTYHYVWDAAADLTAAADKVRHGAVKSYVATEKSDKVTGVQLWAGGPYWAECNLGAENAWETGNYYWWGDTVGYKWNGSKFVRSDGTSDAGFEFKSDNDAIVTYNKNETWLRDNNIIDEKGNLTAAYDAATAKLGAPWRMPTKEDFNNLLSKCTISVGYTLNGVSGYKFTGKEDGYTDKWIFLPFAGYGDGASRYGFGSGGDCWSATVGSGSSYYSWYLDFIDSDDWCVRSYGRYDGFSVRPLSGFTNQ